MPNEMFDGNLARKIDGNLNERRTEYIDGKIVMMAPASTSHNFIDWNLYTIARNYFKNKSCIPFGDGVKVFLTDKNRFVPDFMVVCDRDQIKPDGVYGAPDLVAEILSRSTAYYDRGYKMRTYARCGVREYWIIDTRLKSVEQYILKDGGFELLNLYGIPEREELDCMEPEEREAIRMRLICAIFPGLEIELKDIFYNPLDETAEQESEG